jgi:hypothetical protein
MSIAVINAGKVRDRSTFVYVGRRWAGFPRSRWGNPFRGAGAIEAFAHWINQRPYLVRELSAELEARDLTAIGCWCAPDECHADVLARLVDEYRGHREMNPAEIDWENVGNVFRLLFYEQVNGWRYAEETAQWWLRWGYEAG